MNDNMDSTDGYEELPYIKYRKVVADIVELASMKHQMKGKMEVDVTLAREKLRLYKARTGDTQSFTAWFVKCVAQAVSENKQIHGLRKGKKIVIFNDVDVLIMIEKMMGKDLVALPYVVRKADKKDIKEVQTEIRAAQKHDLNNPSIMIGSKSWLMDLYPHLPKQVRMLVCKVISRNPHHIKANTGTVSVSSIGMIGKVNGWISPISPLPLAFAVCGITKKPGVVEDRIEIREQVALAFAVDHDLIDGAQVTRFLARLTELMEDGFSLE